MNPSDAPISYEFSVPCPILTIKFSEGTRFTAAKGPHELRCGRQPLPKISREQGQQMEDTYFLGGDDSIEDLYGFIHEKNTFNEDIRSMNGDLMGYVTVKRGQMISG